MLTRYVSTHGEEWRITKEMRKKKRISGYVKINMFNKVFPVENPESNHHDLFTENLLHLREMQGFSVRSVPNDILFAHKPISNGIKFK